MIDEDAALAVKPLLINSTISSGGSAKAVLRLFRGLRKLGVGAILVCQERSNSEEGVLGISGWGDWWMMVMLKAFEASLLRLYRQRSKAAFTSAWFGKRIARLVRVAGVNVIHLNQFNNGFLGMNFLRKNPVPTVWTLHDWWSITGGCHVPGVCTRHAVGCGRCPVLNSNTMLDLSRVNYVAKSWRWRNVKVRLVSVSTALRSSIQQSQFFKEKSVEVVPNGLDLEVFRPIPKLIARNALALPDNARILLFGANAFRADTNKGFALVKELGMYLGATRGAEDYMIVTFGDNAGIDDGELGVRSRSFGYVADDVTLALLYSAANVTLVPSRQESFGLIATESLACGTPVLGFRTGGLTDIVDHEQNGFLATPYSITNYIEGADWLLRDADRPEDARGLRSCARDKAMREYGIMNISMRYLAEYSIAKATAPITEVQDC